jgi:carboxylesterase type B
MLIVMHSLSRDGNKKLFHRAIIESGAYTTSHGMATPAMQQNQTMTIAQVVGCGDAADVVACLRKANSSEMFQFWRPAQLEADG